MAIKQGDFTQLATAYANRPGYSLTLLRAIARGYGLADAPRVADIGAGTGKLTADLLELGLPVVAVEPNDAMRAEGERTLGTRAQWRAGSAEDTGLPAASADWILMGSSFHWTDPKRSLPEFHRVLRPGGIFTAIWNPRDLDANPLQREIDDMIKSLLPGLKRVSSGAEKYTAGMDRTLLSTGHFRDLLFMEAPLTVEMAPERYLGVWRSVNDIRAQAGDQLFETIMRGIAERIAGLAVVPVSYKIRAWTVRRVD